MQLESSVTLFDDEKVESKFAELVVDADGIRTEVSKKVGNNEVISRINQSAESVQIQANKVAIEGAAIFTSGRLSTTSLNNTYDANGSATGAVNGLKNDLSSAGGTTVINGGHILTGTLSANAVNASSGTFNTANIPNLSADKITSGSISADRIKANVINAVNGGNGQINADKIKVSDIEIGAAQITSGTINSARIPDLSADKITTGTLNASLIKTGTLQDTNGNTSFNLSTGRLNITKGSINIGDGNFVVNSSGYVTITKGSTIGGFDIVAADDGLDYLASEWEVSGISYLTFIRSANSNSKGKSWAFSTQLKKSTETTYGGTFYVLSNGEFYSGPCNSSGDRTNTLLSVGQSIVKIESEGARCEFNKYGLKYFTGSNSSFKANLYLNDSNYVCVTDNTRSSEQIKTAIGAINNEGLDPNNLYDVDIIQFKYKDGFLDEKDLRYNKELVGFIIEDLNEKYPICVDKRNKDDPKTWSWNEAYLIPPMLKLIQDQKAQIDELKFRMREIEEEINGKRKAN